MNSAAIVGFTKEMMCLLLCFANVIRGLYNTSLNVTLRQCINVFLGLAFASGAVERTWRHNSEAILSHLYCRLWCQTNRFLEAGHVLKSATLVPNAGCHSLTALTLGGTRRRSTSTSIPTDATSVAREWRGARTSRVT